jgi:hypothetical protein
VGALSVSGRVCQRWRASRTSSGHGANPRWPTRIGCVLSHLLKDFPAVRRFQVTQDRLDGGAEARRPEASPADIERIAAVQSVLKVAWWLKASVISNSRVGKLLVVISRVGGEDPA